MVYLERFNDENGGWDTVYSDANEVVNIVWKKWLWWRWYERILEPTSNVIIRMVKIAKNGSFCRKRVTIDSVAGTKIIIWDDGKWLISAKSFDF